MSASFPNDNCRNCKIWQDWKAKAEQVQDERDALLTACEKAIDEHRTKSSHAHEIVISREAFDMLVAGFEKATGKKVLPEYLAVPRGEYALYYWGG